jgi:2-polyprenyl-3-methyl-5-hydroxy-6-metoxy-1,4-benzoquinol methylase
MSQNRETNKEVPLHKRFGFGKNWSNFIESHYSEERVKSSINRFKEFTSLNDLNQVDFIDVGCGSGLHSLAANRLGAQSVFSFDFDPNAVEITQKLRSMEGNPLTWEITQGSILDEEFVSSLSKYDFVYSWGVLHHTGEVWRAIENTSALVKNHGYMYLALYSLNVQTDPEYWLRTKQKYVKSSRFTKVIMEQKYLFRYVYGSSLRNFLKGRFRSENGRMRGMELMTDVRDWLGGWPMEFVLDEDVEKVVSQLGFKLKNVKKGEACTEFLFKKS